MSKFPIDKRINAFFSYNTQREENLAKKRQFFFRFIHSTDGRLQNMAHKQNMNEKKLASIICAADNSWFSKRTEKNRYAQRKKWPELEKRTQFGSVFAPTLCINYNQKGIFNVIQIETEKSDCKGFFRLSLQSFAAQIQSDNRLFALGWFERNGSHTK